MRLGRTERWFWVVCAFGAVTSSPLRIAAQEYFPPLSTYVDTSGLPTDLLEPADDGGSPAAQRIRIKDFRYEQISVADPSGEMRDIGARIKTKLQVREGLELNIPGLEAAFSIALLEGDFAAELVVREEESAVPEENYPALATLTAPSFPIAIKLNPEFFRPMQETAPGIYEPASEGTEPLISLGGGIRIIIRYTWDGETELLLEGGGGPFPSIVVDKPFMLADTGIVLDLGSIMIDLSDVNSPGARPGSWRGIRIDRFRVTFTEGLNGLTSGGVTVPLDATEAASSDPSMAGITLKNFEIGPGGFSGEITGNGLSLGPVDLFDMQLTVNTIGVKFEQNALVGCSLGGEIANFPFFTPEGAPPGEAAKLGLTLAFDLDGNFTIGLDTSDGIDIAWTIPNVLTFHVGSVAFEHRERLFLLRLNGEVEPLFFSETGAEPESTEDRRIQVNGLTITSKGDVSLEGGWLTMPTKKYLGWNRFRIQLSQVGFGRTEGTTSQSWMGFSGGVELAPGLGAAAEMKRLQFLWPSKSPPKNIDVKLDGIGVAFSQPGVVQFSGEVEWFDSVGNSKLGSKGFSGKLNVTLPSLNFTTTSRVVIGSGEEGGSEFKFFYIDLEGQFPTGFPLGTSGVSLYGLTGLFAYNLTPNISAFESPVRWFNAYRGTGNVLGGTPATWSLLSNSLAFGAGVILGTTPDNGFAINGKVALTIAVPGPVVMLSGQAGILQDRTSLSDTSKTPPFVALAIFDGNASTFLINIGVFYEQPYVVKVGGEAEAFFNLNDAADWHLYLGQKTPESRRISAEVLSLLKASAYYQIEPTNYAFGAKAEFGDKWKFGPLRVTLMAWFAYDAQLSWRPVFAWGLIDMGGEVSLKAFGIGVGLQASATLELSTPTPFLVDGKFKVKLNLPWPLPDPKATVHLRWERKADPRPLDEIVSSISLHTRQRDWTITPTLERFSSNSTPTPPSTAVPIPTSSPSDSLPSEGSSVISEDRPLVPLDCYIGVKFEQSVNDLGDLDGGHPGNPFSPNKAQRHIVVLEDTEFEYDAVSYSLVMGEKTGATVSLSSTPVGLYAAWTAIPQSGTEMADNSLNVLSKNNFGYFTHVTFLGTGEDGDWLDWIGGHYGGLFCLDGFDPKARAELWSQYMFQDDTDSSALVTINPQYGCPIDTSYLSDDDFILPPYHVFRFTIDSIVRDPDDASVSSPFRHYRDSIVFHTEGPPLVLDDYVREAVPEFPDRPYYRGYDVGLVFTENYLNKLYRRDDGDFFQLQVLDDNEVPIYDEDGTPAVIDTVWDKAPNAVLTPSEEAWVTLLEALGALSAGSLAKDDLVHARVAPQAAVRPAERHLVRVWYRDDRLASDTRLLDSVWLDRSRVRHVSADRRSAVLFHFAFTSSRYVTFRDVIASYEGKWFDEQVSGAVTPAQIAASIELLDRPFRGPGLAVGNTDTQAIGVFLRHFLSPKTPEAFSPEAIASYIDRTPGFTGDSREMTEAQRSAVVTAWSQAAGIYEEVDNRLGLESNRDPLPDQLEIVVLWQGTNALGLLLEFPEAIDHSRIEILAQAPSTGAYRPVVVPNKESTRLFLFHRDGANLQLLESGLHEFTFTLHRDLGENHPFYYVLDGATTEAAAIQLHLPEDRFEPGGER
jgi:hypothetical protein